MIISASRRTDIPNYYGEWFFNRIKEGFCCVRNPMNPHQVSRICLSPDVVDAIVFWTKNPENMLDRLEELKEYHYYFQFTLTGYGRDIEPGIPNKPEHMMNVFRRLSDRIGPKRVIWRYDPILINHTYNLAYHQKAFSKIANGLKGYTEQVVISFVDVYAKTRRAMEQLQVHSIAETDMITLARNMAGIAKNSQMEIVSCGEQMDLQTAGVRRGSCIDRERIEMIVGCKLEGKRDKNQRAECGCLESVDIGTYDTCRNGCKYCYANRSDKRVTSNIRLYDVNSPLLCGEIIPEDRITERMCVSLKCAEL